MVRGAVELLAFLCELAMLVLLAVAGWALGGGGLMSIALSVFYPALAILVWGVWMAPKSSRRLEHPWRLVAQIALFLGVGALALPHHPLAGILFSVVAISTFVVSRFTTGSARPT
ncbi:MAG: YrdB family protein [Actinomycetota bacterium]|nr:YrdB family protein [Actinomycetota bacterium]